MVSVVLGCSDHADVPGVYVSGVLVLLVTGCCSPVHGWVGRCSGRNLRLSHHSLIVTMETRLQI